MVRKVKLFFTGCSGLNQKLKFLTTKHWGLKCISNCVFVNYSSHLSEIVVSIVCTESWFRPDFPKSKVTLAAQPSKENRTELKNKIEIETRTGPIRNTPPRPHQQLTSHGHTHASTLPRHPRLPAAAVLFSVDVKSSSPQLLLSPAVAPLGVPALPASPSPLFLSVPYLQDAASGHFLSLFLASAGMRLWRWS